MTGPIFQFNYVVKEEAWLLAKLVLAQYRRGTKIVIFPHIRSDGDSYGSSVALAMALEKLGFAVKIYLEEVPDAQNEFFNLEPYAEIFDSADPLPQFVQDADLAWMLDCSELSRLGERLHAWETISEHLVTDHHLSTWENTERIWIDPSEPAVSSMVHDLLLSWERMTETKLFDRKIAESLYAALLTDTGRFTYSKVSDRTFRQAAHLKTYGVNQQAITERFFEQMRKPRMLAYGFIIDHLKLYANERVAVSCLTYDFQKQTGAVDTDFTGLVSWMRQLEGVDLTVLFIEAEDGVWRGTSRSSKQGNAKALAEHFGGGGHREAAGFNLDKVSIEDANAFIKDHAEDFLC